jgi:acyl-coenzyme A thioesterase 9
LKRTFVTDVVQEQQQQQQQQQQQPLLQHSLPPKTPKDSFIEKILPFSKDKRLRNGYINHFGHLRVGLILEDLDRMAAAIAYKHVLGESKEIAANRLEGNKR